MTDGRQFLKKSFALAISCLLVAGASPLTAFAEDIEERDDAVVQVEEPNLILVDSAEGEPEEVEPEQETTTEDADATEDASVKLAPASDDVELPEIEIGSFIGDATISGIANKTYTGKYITQNISVMYAGKALVEGADYSVSYDSNRFVGTAKVIINGRNNWYGSVTKTFKINKATNPIKASAIKDALSVTYKPTASITTSKNVGTTGKVGELSYENASTSTTTKSFIVNRTTGNVTLPKATRAGTYTVRVKVTAAGNQNYNSGSKTVSYTITVKKATNPMTVTPATRTASYTTLKMRAVTVTKPLTISGSIGTKTYTRAQNSNYFTVDNATGKVTIKKGTPKGTYTLKIKVTAAGGPNYKSGSKTATCKITVK